MGKDTPFLSSENIKICGRITKLEAIKCHLFEFSSISAEYLQKFEFLISQGIVATCLRLKSARLEKLVLSSACFLSHSGVWYGLFSLVWCPAAGNTE